MLIVSFNVLLTSTSWRTPPSTPSGGALSSLGKEPRLRNRRRYRRRWATSTPFRGSHILATSTLCLATPRTSSDFPACSAFPRLRPFVRHTVSRSLPLCSPLSLHSPPVPHSFTFTSSFFLSHHVTLPWLLTPSALPCPSLVLTLALSIKVSARRGYDSALWLSLGLDNPAQDLPQPSLGHVYHFRSTPPSTPLFSSTLLGPRAFGASPRRGSIYILTMKSLGM